MIETKTIIKELREFVKKYDTNKLAAAALRVTPSQLSTTLNGSVNVIPERILKKLGYKSELVYLPLKTKKPAAKKAAPAKKSQAKRPAATPAKTPLNDRPQVAITRENDALPVAREVPVSDGREGSFIDVNSRD